MINEDKLSSIHSKDENNLSENFISDDEEN